MCGVQFVLVWGVNDPGIHMIGHELSLSYIYIYI